MPVIPLTLVISLCLTATFIIFFIREHGRRRFSSAESDALLPLAGETSRVAAAPITLDLEGRRSAKPHLRRVCGGKHAHDGDHQRCEGCEHRHEHGHA
ncbi:MAG: hypothetical protein ABII82_01585 [Verrucomicrobiota bacterium]